MANGVVIPNIRIGRDTFSGTTDATGNLLLATDTKRAVMGVEFSGEGLTGYGFLYYVSARQTYNTYLRVLSNANALKTNTAVSGTYTYMEL